jgi:glycosyltransferase involved in cell wall biosynthesis
VIDPKRPLATFALFAFNQENVIREAVEAALAQDYSPLEIILSDDNSSDGTFAIMQEIAANYVGPHYIKLNRTSSNKGVSGHLTSLLSLATGDLIVIGAGDDISLPGRVSQLVDTAMDISSNLSNECICLYSDYEELDSERLQFKQFTEFSIDHLISFSGPVGATLAISKGLWTRIKRLRTDLVNEDRFFSFVAAFSGSLVRCPEVLIRYRPGGISAKGEPSINQTRKFTSRYFHDAAAKVDFIVDNLLEKSNQCTLLSSSDWRILTLANRERNSRLLELDSLMDCSIMQRLRRVPATKPRSIIRSLIWFPLKQLINNKWRFK